MSWKMLTDIAQLDEIISKSKSKTQVIFKHSIRCSISSVAKGRLERSEFPADVDFYYLDLINYRELSNKISEVFMVEHESPQVLVIKNGVSVYDESHMGINMQDIITAAA
ncbi:MAG: bacillithiol system redox-active protein YtxJ [Chitinophagaceae bacterium]|nr:bacillithiol system redox-active protein YtxJ [Chitinophagaceae bacterium]